MPDSGLNVTSAPVRRLKSLDVLRAVAILLMVFSGLLPKTLPNWMDHGYNPHYLPDASGTWTLRPEIANPTTQPVSLFRADWPAFTWVDLVFPMFLFAMGAAIPMALTRVIELRRSAAGATIHVLGRWLMLILFAALVVHLSPSFMKSSVPNAGRLIVIASFLLAFLFFVRWPAGTPVAAQRTIRLTAFGGMVALMVAYAVRNQTAFDWAKSDRIILVLAHTYLVASIAWMLTRRHPGLRFIVLIPLMLLAHYMQFNSPAMTSRQWLGTQPFNLLDPIVNSINAALNVPEWVSHLVTASSEQALNQQEPKPPGAWEIYIAPLFNLSGLWQFSWYKYLFVVIPGTIAGDWLVAWSTRRTISNTPFESDAHQLRPSSWTLPVVILLAVVLFVGLRHAGYPFMKIGGPLKTPWLALLAVPVLILLGKCVLPTAYGSLWISRRLFYLGSGFLLAGLALACLPDLVNGNGFFEGGISKGPPATLSFYFISVGLCTFLMMALTTIYDYDFNYGIVTSLLEANGQNAMLAYYLAHTVLGAVTTLGIFTLFNSPLGTGVESLDDFFVHYLRLDPWLLACWAAAKTLFVALVVWFFSALRLYWRA